MEKHETEFHWMCTKCGQKEIPQEAEYCEDCQKAQFRHIGGWLWLPLISLFLTLGLAVYGTQPYYEFFIRYFPGITNVIYYSIAGSGAMLVLKIIWTLLTLFLFLIRSRLLPKCFIGLIIISVLDEVARIGIGVHLLDMRADYQQFMPLVRQVIYGAIWIPYFVMSVRVKETFVR